MSELATLKKSPIAVAIEAQKNLVAEKETEVKETVLRLQSFKVITAENRDDANKAINVAAKLVKMIDDGEKVVTTLFKAELIKRKEANEAFTKQVFDEVARIKQAQAAFIQAEETRKKLEDAQIAKEKQAKIDAGSIVSYTKGQVGDITTKLVKYLETELAKCKTEDEVRTFGKRWANAKPIDNKVADNYKEWMKGNETAIAEYSFETFKASYEYNYSQAIKQVSNLEDAAIANINGDKLAIERAKIESEEREKADAERKLRLDAEAAEARMKAEIEAQAKKQASEIAMKGVRRVKKLVPVTDLSGIPMQSWATLLASFLTKGNLDKLEFLITNYPLDGDIPEGLKVEEVVSNIAK